MCVNGSKGTCHENPGNKILTMGTLCKACEQVALHGLWMARTDGHLQAPLAAFTSSAMSPILWKASMQISTSVFTAPHCISQLQHNCTTRILLNKKKSHPLALTEARTEVNSKCMHQAKKELTWTKRRKVCLTSPQNFSTYVHSATITSCARIIKVNTKANVRKFFNGKVTLSKKKRKRK